MNLSKAYGVIERMSEDVELKVVLDEQKMAGIRQSKNT